MHAQAFMHKPRAVCPEPLALKGGGQGGRQGGAGDRSGDERDLYAATTTAATATAATAATAATTTVEAKPPMGTCIAMETVVKATENKV